MSSLLRTRAVSVWLLAGFLALGAGALSASASVDASGVEGALVATSPQIDGPRVEAASQSRCISALRVWLKSHQNHRPGTTIYSNEDIDVNTVALRVALNVRACNGVNMIQDGTAQSPNAGPIFGEGFSYTALT
jgi:hypothetical protein